MDKLPEYINCQNEKIVVCGYYMHRLCEETCAYALDIKGLGVGAMMVPPKSTTVKDFDKLFLEDMMDYWFTQESYLIMY